MPELMYFYIVSGYVDGEARIIREFHDDQRGFRNRPSGTLFEIAEEIEISDLDAWNGINARLEAEATRLKITTLHNLYPDKETANIVKIAAKLRTQNNSSD